ncbi:MAG: lipid A export permease/ATP-binding protein MsbA [Sutterella sp.]|nr:lipid A export permease/ATP-binding protein MsbA [Sutterella sp.]
MSGLIKRLTRRMDPDLARLYRYFAQYKVTLVFATLFMVISASTSSVTATLLGKLTDVGFYQGEAAWVLWAAPLALIGITMVYALSTVMSAYLMARISQDVLKKLRTQLFSSFIHWPAERYLEHSTGLVSSKFVNEAAMALGGAAQSAIVLIRDSVQVVALIGVLVWHNWQLTLVTFIVAPAMVWMVRTIARHVRRIVSESQMQIGRMISNVEESYESERLVKISGTYDAEDERFAKVSGRIRRLQLNAMRMQSLSTPLTQVLIMVAIAVVVGVALLEAQQGRLTFGEFITFLSAMLLVKGPIQHLAGLNGTFATIAAAAKSVFTLLDTEPEADNGTVELERVRGEVRFDNVSFVYPGTDKEALRQIHFTVKPGEHIALVGNSGAGKTTIVNLLPRFWNPSSGRILLDGVDTQTVTLESLRRQFAFVSQDIVLLNDTLRANLVYGLDGITEAQLWEVLETVQLTDWVKGLPQGLDSPVGEGASLLSGGQKQRLSIARALLKDAPILVLDEAMSALDAQNEYLIQKALETLSAGRTTFTISHRLTSMRDVDRIFVVQDGRLVEMGTQDELLAQDGVFARLLKLQALDKTE